MSSLGLLVDVDVDRHDLDLLGALSLASFWNCDGAEPCRPLGGVVDEIVDRVGTRVVYCRVTELVSKRKEVRWVAILLLL